MTECIHWKQILEWNNLLSITEICSLTLNIKCNTTQHLQIMQNDKKWCQKTTSDNALI